MTALPEKQNRINENRILKEKKGLQNSRGFTLLEVMVSLVILSIGVIGHMGLQNHVIKTRSFSKHLGEAMAAGSRQMEELRCTIFDLVDPGITMDYRYNDGTTADFMEYYNGQANLIESTVEGFDSIGLPYHPDVELLKVNMLKTNTEWMSNHSHYSSKINSFEIGGKTVDQEQGIINPSNIF